MEVIFVLFLYFMVYFGVPLLIGWGLFFFFRQLPIGWQILPLLLSFFTSLALLAGWLSAREEKSKEGKLKELGNDPLVPWANPHFPVITFVFIAIITWAGLTKIGTEGIIWCAGFSWGYLFWQALWQEVMIKGSIASGFESSLMLLIRVKYLFKRGSPEEAIMQRIENQKKQRREREFQAKRKELEGRERNIQRRLKGFELQIPEASSLLPESARTYTGYFDQLNQRFQEKQLARTLRVTRERVQEARKLYEEGAGVIRARQDFERASYEFHRRDKTFEIEEKQAQARYERVDLENDLKLLKLKVEKAEKEIELGEKNNKLKELRQYKEKKEPSLDERVLQSTKDRIKMLKAKGASLEMAVKARDEQVGSLDQEKNRELYQIIKNMWNNFIIQVLK